MSNFWHKKKHLLSRILMVTGITMILFFGVYEGINYPWKTLLSRFSATQISEELSDPAPLPVFNKIAEEKETTQDSNEIMKNQPSIFDERPEINLEFLGIIKIPKIQLSENIVEGSLHEMLYAVGHVKGSAMPGESGNCVLSGHRGYIYMHPFRYLDMLTEGDNVYVTYEEKKYTYEIFKVFNVNPSDTWVMQPQQNEENLLTLITCTPLVTYTHRMIVWGRLVNTE